MRENDYAGAGPRAKSAVVNRGPFNGLWEYRAGDPVRHAASGQEGRLVVLQGDRAEVDLGQGQRRVVMPLSSLAPVLPCRRLPAEVVEVVDRSGRVVQARQVLAGLGDAEAERLRQGLPARPGCRVRVRLIDAA